MAQLTAPRAVKTQVVMKAETTAGVDVLAGSYTVADILNVIGDSVTVTQDPNEIENKMTAGNLGRAPSMIGKLTALVEASMWFRGAGQAYTASIKPELDMVLRAAGHSAVFTTSGGAKYTYQPTNTEETFTVYVVVDVPGGNALSFQLVGALCSKLTMQAQAGQGMRVDFALMGALEERADITYVAGTLSPTPTPPVTKAAAFTIDDGSAYAGIRLKSLGFDAGQVVQYIDSINAAGAVAGCKIFDRSPTLSIDPEADREANSGWWAMLRDGSPMNLATFQIGTAANNRLKFQFGAGGVNKFLQAVRQGLSVRDGLMALPTTLRATISAGNDDYALVFD